MPSSVDVERTPEQRLDALCSIRSNPWKLNSERRFQATWSQLIYMGEDLIDLGIFLDACRKDSGYRYGGLYFVPSFLFLHYWPAGMCCHAFADNPDCHRVVCEAGNHQCFSFQNRITYFLDTFIQKTFFLCCENEQFSAWSDRYFGQKESTGDHRSASSLLSYHINNAVNAESMQVLSLSIWFMNVLCLSIPSILQLPVTSNSGLVI